MTNNHTGKLSKFKRLTTMVLTILRKVWRCQRGNQKATLNGQTIQCPNSKGPQDKRWLTKYYRNNKRLNNTNSTKNGG